MAERRTTVDGLADAIMDGLKKYADLATDTVKDAVKDASKTVKKEIRDVLDITVKDKDKQGKPKKPSASDTKKLVAELTDKMKDAAKHLDFELAAALRDKIIALKSDKTK